MEFKSNQSVWDVHYRTERSRQNFPDENVVRYIHHYLRNFSGVKKPAILDLGCGSGRNLRFLEDLGLFCVGSDFSFEALSTQANVLQSTAVQLPFKDHSFDLIIAWGVLHYLPSEAILKAVDEILRVLSPQGRFLGTLRSSEDTHLKEVLEKGDLQQGAANLFSEEELRDILSKFKSVHLGYISRVPIGSNRVIAHHMFEAIV